MKIKLLLLFAASICLTGIQPLFAQTSDTQKRIETPVKQSIDIRQTTQKQEEQWRLEREKLVLRLEQLQEQNKALNTQRDGVSEQVKEAQARLARKEKQLADIEEITHLIQPFLEQRVADLTDKAAEGLPFLTAERRQRIDRLKQVMADPEIAASEKYRKVMEALLIEAEYSFTIEVYQETIELGANPMRVDILRLGRLNLFYLSLDRTHCGFYNVAAGGWQALDASHLPEIQTAVDIAAKRRTATLLTLPLGRVVTQ
jgi:hypothetical protein